MSPIFFPLGLLGPLLTLTVVALIVIPSLRTYSAVLRYTHIHSFSYSHDCNTTYPFTFVGKTMSPQQEKERKYGEKAY